MSEKVYKSVRSQMQMLDLLAFEGRGIASGLIKAHTRSNCSHVGAVTLSRLVGAVDGDVFDGTVVSCFESTSLDGSDGVREVRVSDLVRNYEGNIWWCPMLPDVRKTFDLPRALDWMYRQRGKKYDFKQAVLSGLDRWQKIFGSGAIDYTKEDLSKLFCSELIHELMERGRAIPKGNSSEVTPRDLLRLEVFDVAGAVQLRGSGVKLRF